MKNILVTGGLGFIGSNFIRMLLRNDLVNTIINFDKQTYAGNRENLASLESDSRYEFIKSDICDATSFSSCLRNAMWMP